MLEGFDAEAVSQIRARLDLVRQSGVKILFAIESGSRAWGFPSPDSDYDCRFVYIRPVEDHLVLRVQRDVIEFPIEGEIDAGGWDLRKALLLALKGNAVILEWANAPHVYEEMPGFRRRLLDMLTEIEEPELVARHYFGLLKRHDFVSIEGEIRLKRLFYAIRPALSLSYMEERGYSVLPPMDIGSLLAGVKMPAGLADLLNELLAVKKVTREMGTGPVPDQLAIFLKQTRERFDALMAKTVAMDAARDKQRLAIAESFYRKTVRDLGGQGRELSLVNHDVLR